ncbi:hypothetical protein PDJAM_G00087700 [Pangasius djambal]|uniref:Uncharacterized protein n=1 Tax=Pangasius djambal TaxID=1691987 RepID=A0ACC5Z5G4_9TELE|nr:hypothetical protein [Pangasius djambal]
MRDAAVVCRELRCGEPVNAPQYGLFGRGSGPIWMDDVACSGSETTLKNCRSGGWGISDCDHRHDAGVTCSGQNVRLTVGPHRCSGRVEVFHGGSWSTVCDADFDQQDAEVVCRELGCGIPVEVLGSAAFGRGEGQVWTEELQCRGTESEIYFCPTSSSLKHSDCSHYNDVGLKCSGHTEARLVNGPDSCSGRVELQYLSEWGTVCSVGWDMRAADVLCAQLDCGSAVAVVEVDWFGEGSGHIWADVFDYGVRLVNGGSRCAGRVEVLHDGQWGTVCASAWDMKDAAVVCRELRCGEPVDLRYWADSGQGSGPIWIYDLYCRGSESTLNNCSSRGGHDCYHVIDAGVICSGSVRLVNGGSRCAGRVEVLQDGQWGTVCGDDWDMREAAVVCRELRCGEPVDAPKYGHFGRGSGPIWMDDVACSGSETTLKNCRSGGWGISDCDHRHDAGVTCSGENVRLTAGPHRCSGRVEVFHGGSWSTVCDADFDQQDAEVVCRELGCGIPVEVLGSAAFGRGEGQVWTEELQCRGTESEIYFCPTSSSLKHSNCSHYNDVGLKCSG